MSSKIWAVINTVEMVMDEEQLSVVLFKMHINLD